MILFALFAGGGFALILSPLLAPELESLTAWLARLSGGIIHFAGGHVEVAGNTLTAPSGFSIAVANGCNGINVLILLWAAQLAWPAAGWADKLKKAAIGTPIIFLVNTIRIITLYYLGQWNREWFEWMHLYVWEVLIMMLGLAVFALGIRQTPRTAAAGAAKSPQPAA